MRDGVQRNGMTKEQFERVKNVQLIGNLVWDSANKGTFDEGRNKAKRERRKIKGVRK